MSQDVASFRIINIYVLLYGDAITPHSDSPPARHNPDAPFWNLSVRMNEMIEWKCMDFKYVRKTD